MLDKLKDPKNRVKYALWLLFGSLVLMVINVALYLFGIIDEAMLILITLILSWLAITLTAVDIVATTDVRANDDDKKQ